MTIKQIFEQLHIPFAYMRFRQPQAPPYVIYFGNGQYDFAADNTYRYKRNLYQIEYYFTEKNEANEEAIETALLANGYNYTKSEDVFIESEGVFVIYYDV